ncbi:uncharacterized protein BHQ10_007783 [Talaromyces amestolkiae]|uniref:Zn(2)-C6 fungal-type domain-containing protein n=1 Tax=Talaromyces amestolkiae TaxID=1196081 RepID=A0A364L7V2_TALAM|nr:uncharacterized protein BHQ10_007783 [Talaromyces amestolkiae]RAO71771.1 hypothetical protein BHQ10_007783 [Talaromyces amestolkiae]
MAALRDLQLAVSGRRSSKVCARCRQRKTKCDSGYPSCSACMKAGAVCRGFDSHGHQDLPRSLLRALEDQVTELERQASKLHHSPANITLALTSKLAQATLLADTSGLRPFFLSNTTSSVLSKPSCLPLAVCHLALKPSSSSGADAVQSQQQQCLSSTNLRRIPYAAIEQMLSNYTNIHLPQYPCVSEQYIYDAVGRLMSVHDGDTDAVLSLGIPACSDLTHYDYFMVFIVFAVSSLTLTWKNEHQARTASNAFFDTALHHLRLAPEVTDIQRLQTYLLLAHYANLNPSRADNWMCIWNATRIVLDLGLHKQASVVLLQDEIEEAAFPNKLFWCTYGMERSLSATVRLSLALPEDSITASHDTDWDADTKYASASHLYRFRALETEVHRTLYLQQDTRHRSRTDLNSWIGDIIHRLDAWLERATEFSKYQMLEFRMVQYGLLKARLFRPSPGLECRTAEDREQCFNACTILVEDYQHQTRRRRLFYPWHGVHNLFEAAVIMLESCWALRDYEPLRYQARHILAVTLPDCLTLLNKVGESWQEATLCSVYLSPILEETARAYSDRALAQMNADRIAAESITTGKLRKLLFPDGPLLWESRSTSFEPTKEDSADAHIALSLEPVVSTGTQEIDWDAYWEHVQDLSPIWTGAQASDVMKLSDAL